MQVQLAGHSKYHCEVGWVSWAPETYIQAGDWGQGWQSFLVVIFLMVAHDKGPDR